MGKTLTPELIQLKCKTDKLASIKNLNLWGNDLEDISLIREMPNIEICSLSLNKIYSLKDFVQSKKLTELYLRKNLITDLTEAKYLVHCPALKVLWLWDNPISEHPLYRQYILKILPNLVKLDNSAVTQEEREDAKKSSITDQDIINNNPAQQQKQADESAYHQHYERPKSVNAIVRSDQRGKSPMQPQNQPQVQPQSQIQLQNQNQIQSNGQTNNGGGARNENILCAVLALLKELDESGLELVKRDIEHVINFRTVLEYVAKLLAPESIIAQAREIKQLNQYCKHHRMDQNEKIESLRKANQLQPGDLVLIRTPSTVYESFRRMANHKYDHIVKISCFNNQLVSFPTLLFTHKKKQPLIIRPRLTDTQRTNFLETLRQEASGKPYDYMRVIQIIISTQLYEMQKYDENKNDKIVCSHQIYQSLAACLPQLRDYMKNNESYDIHKYGTFTISDFVKLAKQRPDAFEMFELYNPEELAQDVQNQIDFEGIVIQLGNERKKHPVLEQILEIGALKKLQLMIEKYQFLKTISEQSKPVLEQVLSLKKQIIFAITVYKILDIILTSYREYKELNNLESSVKKKTKAKILKEIIFNLAQILIISVDAKEPLSHKLMKPLTKLMIITGTGSPGDIKIQVLKMITVVMGFTQKLRERFKL